MVSSFLKFFSLRHMGISYESLIKFSYTALSMVGLSKKNYHLPSKGSFPGPNGFLSNGKTTDLCILPLLSQNEYYSIRKKALNNFRVKALSKFAPLPVRPLPVRLTPGRLTKFVYIIGWAVLDRNLGFVAAVFWRATEVDFPVNLTTFHSRMSTMQPARAGCTTSKRCHKCCWHFCSSSSYKTIPSIEFPVARLFIRGSMVTVFSLKITQVFVFIARINCKVKWHPYSHQKP